MDVQNLIKSVKSRVAIWNRQHPQYNDRDCSLILWKEVAEENGITVESARCKWRGLRDSYRIQLRKSILAKKNGVCQPQTWTYFDEMSFVKDQIYVDINRRKYWPEGSVKDSALKRNGKYSSSNEDEDSGDEVFHLSNKRSKLSEVTVTNSIRQKLLPRIEKEVFGKNSENMEIQIKEEDGRDFCAPAELCTTEFTEDTEAQLELNSTTTDIDSTLHQWSDEDEPCSNAPLLQKKLKALQDDNYCFLMSILPQMKALPAKQKFLARIKIQELLLAEVSNIENKICPLEPR